MSFQITQADLHSPQHADAIVRLIDDYAAQDIGGGEGLAPLVKEKLIRGLLDFPTTIVFLAFDGEDAVGVAVCFLGFSTFAAKQLINIHDLAVTAKARGRGIGSALIARVEEKGRELGCCKVTLEVLENNQVARRLYERKGFHQLVYKAESGGALFFAKQLEGQAGDVPIAASSVRGPLDKPAPLRPPPLPQASTGNFALECKGLHKSFHSTRAVQGLDLRVPKGMLYAFLGPNGAGKTTTLRMIAGLTRPDRGQILIGGRNIAADAVSTKQILAYIPDDPLLYGKLKPMEHLEFVAALWSMPAEEARSLAKDLLIKLGLWGKLDEQIEGLSRGMKQKLALAAAFLHKPEVILLDEPLTGLDAAAAKLVKTMLTDFVRQGGTVILTTHIMEVAERMADRIGIIHKGVLKCEGSLEELRAYAGTETLEDVFLQLTEAAPADARLEEASP